MHLFLKIYGKHFNYLFFLIHCSVAANALTQVLDKTFVSISMDNALLTEVFTEIESQTDYQFAYSDEIARDLPHINIKVTHKNLKILLDGYSTKLNFDYKVNGQVISVKMKSAIPAQQDQQTVKGTVVDREGIPIPGASIAILNSKRGTTTDFDGNFAIPAMPGKDTLKISYIGYITRQIIAGQGMKVTLQSDVTNLDQVVLVSYGKQKNKLVTGSLSQVNASKVQEQPVTQFAEQLKGQIAGVQVEQISGQPGRGIGFKIRGAASFNASNQPLIVIDGIPITGSINNINPSEIETFTVLKDASSTALYGSRAANGVILITTKHAKPGVSSIEATITSGLQTIPKSRIPNVMNAREFAQFQNEYYKDRVRYEGYKGKLDTVYQNPERYGEGTNWFETVTRAAPVQKYNVIVSSANDKFSSTAIAGYQKQDGVVINTGTQLFSLRLNQSLSLNDDKIKIGFNLAPSYRLDHNNRLDADGLNGYFQDILEASPLVAPINPDGSLPLYVNSPGMVNTVNPYAKLTKLKDDYKTTRILANAYLDLQLWKGLTLKQNLAVDKGAETRNRFVPSVIVGSNVASGYSSSVDNYSWTSETTLDYSHTFFKKHHLDALVGYSAQKFNTVSSSVEGTQFPSDDIEWISAATLISGGSSNTDEFSLLSQIARLTYDFDEKYLFSAAVRRDGSSRFGADKKYGVFPSVSLGWVISDEGFLNNSQFVNFLKIRGSYGVTGNNDIGNYTHIARTGKDNYVFNGNLASGTTITTLGNRELAWEKNKQLDLGVDFNFLKNRISLTYDYYHKISDDHILNREIPVASGFSSINYNVGELEFWGHEITINSRNLTGEFQWDTNLNISINRNTINSLVKPGFIKRNNSIYSDYYRQQEGHALGEFYGFIFQGLYNTKEEVANGPEIQIGGFFSDVGTIRIKDVNGDGLITADDRTFIGDPTPDFNFGFTNNFRYKNLDLGITLTGQVGGKILNPTKWAYLTNLDGARNLLTAVKDRWRSIENPGSGVYPRTERGTTAIGRAVNTQWIENGTYLTASNITLGYNFEFNNSSYMKNLRLFTSIQRAFTITDYSGINPEINAGGVNPTNGIGIDETAYPVPRTISIGLNAKF